MAMNYELIFTERFYPQITQITRIIMDVVVFMEILLIGSTMIPCLYQSTLGILEGHATAPQNITGTPELSYQDYFSKSPEQGDELCDTRLLPPHASHFSNLHQAITSLCYSLFQPSTKYSPSMLLSFPIFTRILPPMFLSFPIFKLGVRKFTSALLFGSVLPFFTLEE